MMEEIPLEPIYKTTRPMQTTTQTQISLNQLVSTIDTTINKQYAGSNPFQDFFGKFFLSEEDAHFIVNTLTQIWSAQTYSDELIDALCKKNEFFRKSIEYFITLARKNIDAVTDNTLEVIEKPHLQQPIPALNTLSPIIKAFVIKKAYENIEYFYHITLSHQKNITRCDISSAAHLAATIDEGHDNIRIWNLSTGTLKQLINCLAHRIRFNSDGSRIAAISENEQNRYIIKEWDTHSAQLLYTIDLLDLRKIAPSIAPYNIYYTDCRPDNTQTLSLLFEKNGKVMQSLWLISPNNAPSFLGISTLPDDITMRSYYLIESGDYSTKNPASTSTPNNRTITITKKNCQPLYLCNTATDNTQQTASLKKIKKSQSYAQLDEFQKKLVNKNIKKRTTVLLAVERLNNQQTTSKSTSNDVSLKTLAYRQYQ